MDVAGLMKMHGKGRFDKQNPACGLKLPRISVVFGILRATN